MNERSAARRGSVHRRLPPRQRPRIGLALAGGGPLGAIYEIGALAALAEALRGMDFNDADVYVGVSAGAFIAAGLANGFTPYQMSRLFIEGHKTDDRFDPAILLRPALREYWRRIRSLPPLAAGALWNYVVRPGNLMGSLERLGRAIPTGLFNGDEVDRYLARIFSQPGRTNDFRQLGHKLFLVATDLDTGEAVAFGSKGYEHVPISRAVQASAALPGVFPPVRIDGRDFVDGALRKTLHASIALEQGVDLLLCLNPLVPYDATPHHRTRDREHHLDKLVEGGLPVVLAQTFRSIIHSRLGAGMERYKTAYPDSDIVLFQPNRADADMFFTNLFSYSSRRRLCEHAYQKTRHELWVRRHELAPTLARHGIEIDVAVLRDESLTLVKSIRRHRETWIESRSSATTRMLGHTLDDLERWLRVAAG
ncbi:patatin family protein [Betaproteobacteria bacterium PRO7]|nr:patatin family protein [Betaproteobacteria bacterium PRO7]